jgi:hypothetical protein
MSVRTQPKQPPLFGTGSPRRCRCPRIPGCRRRGVPGPRRSGLPERRCHSPRTRRRGCRPHIVRWLSRVEDEPARSIASKSAGVVPESGAGSARQVRAVTYLAVDRLNCSIPTTPLEHATGFIIVPAIISAAQCTPVRRCIFLRMFSSPVGSRVNNDSGRSQPE